MFVPFIGSHDVIDLVIVVLRMALSAAGPERCRAEQYLRAVIPHELVIAGGFPILPYGKRNASSNMHFELSMKYRN